MSFGLATTAILFGALGDRSVLDLSWDQMDLTDHFDGQVGKAADISRRFRGHPQSFLTRLPLSHSLGQYVCGIFLHHHKRWFRITTNIHEQCNRYGQRGAAMNQNPQYYRGLFCLAGFDTVAFHRGSLPGYTRARSLQHDRRIFPGARSRRRHDADAHRLADWRIMCHFSPVFPPSTQPPPTGVDLRSRLTPLPHLVVLPTLHTASHRANMVTE